MHRSGNRHHPAHVEKAIKAEQGIGDAGERAGKPPRGAHVGHRSVHTGAVEEDEADARENDKILRVVVGDMLRRGLISCKEANTSPLLQRWHRRWAVLQVAHAGPDDAFPLPQEPGHGARDGSAPRTPRPSGRCSWCTGRRPTWASQYWIAPMSASCAGQGRSQRAAPRQVPVPRDVPLAGDADERVVQGDPRPDVRPLGVRVNGNRNGTGRTRCGASRAAAGPARPAPPGRAGSRASPGSAGRRGQFAGAAGRAAGPVPGLDEPGVQATGHRVQRGAGSHDSPADDEDVQLALSHRFQRVARRTCPAAPGDHRSACEGA